MEEYTKMITGENYNPMTPYLISLRDRTRGLISDFNQEKDEKKEQKWNEVPPLLGRSQLCERE